MTLSRREKKLREGYNLEKAKNKNTTKFMDEMNKRSVTKYVY